MAEILENSQAAEKVAEIDLAITGMTCASCVARVEKKLNKVPGVKAVVNLATEKAHLEIAPEAKALSQDELIAVVEKAGYGANFLRRVDIGENGERVAAIDGAARAAAEAAEEAAKAAAAARVKDLWRRFWIALVLAVPVILISMIPALQFPAWQWVIAVPALVIAVYCGWTFHRAAFRAARHGGSTMDTLVSLGVIASMGWSLWALLWGGAGEIGYVMHMSGVQDLAGSMHPHVYFESAAMIVAFLLLGRWLEARSRRSAGDALHELLELGASQAFVLRRSDGTELNAEIPAAELREGDVFLVKPGEKIATDGIVVAGDSAVDAALLTGESVPVEVAEGSSVTGATINTYGRLEVRATRVGEETTLAQMGRLLTEAQTGKAPVQRLADKISSIFVPAVLIIAALDLLVRLAIGNSLEMALTSAITVLVVACPCALGLATPTALLVGSGAASKRGILIRGPEVLENAHRATVALLDKTGTLTKGEMKVMEVTPVDVLPDDVRSAVLASSDKPMAGLGGLGLGGFGGFGGFGGDNSGAGSEADPQTEDEAAQRLREAILAVAGSVEAPSEHPIAQAIAARAKELGYSPIKVTDFRNVPGQGVEAVLDLGLFADPEDGPTVVRAGKPEWILEIAAASTSGLSGSRTVGSDLEFDPNAVPQPDGVKRETVDPYSEAVAGASAIANEKPVEAALLNSFAEQTREQEFKARAAQLNEIVDAYHTLGATAIMVALGDTPIGIVGVADELRAESAQAMAELKQAGVEPVMISGDAQRTADAVAAQLGMTARGGVLPEGKVAAVKEYQERGENVVMVGDGVNDAAALAAADLSIAMGAGTDVAKAAADITIVNSDPRLVPSALRISRRTLKIVKENLAWAFGYNLIAIPLALAGIIAPGLAAAAMASSSVIVVGNSLRLRSAK